MLSRASKRHRRHLRSTFLPLVSKVNSELHTAHASTSRNFFNESALTATWTRWVHPIGDDLAAPQAVLARRLTVPSPADSSALPGTLAQVFLSLLQLELACQYDDQPAIPPLTATTPFSTAPARRGDALSRADGNSDGSEHVLALSGLSAASQRAERVGTASKHHGE